MNKRKLLIADDSEMNRAILANMLEPEFDIIEVSDGSEALIALQEYKNSVSAVLLDVVMPGMDGFEVLEEMNRRHWIDLMPVIMISVESGNSFIDRAFSLGASDYISRPFAPGIVRRRIVNTILLHTKKQQLTNVVASWFGEREKNSEILVTILDHAVEIHNGSNENHGNTVGDLTGLLLDKVVEKTDRYSVDLADREVICLAAGLHDLGKLLISEDILKKPERLTPEEFETVRRHASLGSEIIKGIKSFQDEKLVKYAVEICLGHHERWDGEGYPQGLAGDSIPIVAQIVAIADVYDALTHARPYKPAFSSDEAIQMITNGECGCFNPLLLDCLREVADELNGDSSSRKVGHGRGIKESVEDIYNKQDLMAVRLTNQIEETNAKIDFMNELSDEFWFEYTVQPSSLHLSRGGCQKLGLPPVTVDPLETPAVLSIVGKEAVAAVQKRLSKLSPDETYTELNPEIELNGKMCRCRLSVRVLRSNITGGKFSSLIGKVTDIDERYERLKDFEDAASDTSDTQVLLPVIADNDDVLKISQDKVGYVLRGYGKMFETVRIVDPGICMHITVGESGGKIEQVKNCYAEWGKSRRCDRCISQDAIATRKTQSKIETVGNRIYYVLAMRVDIDGIPYSLECASSIVPDITSEKDESSVLNQLLVRNRQVYTDSTTKVFNRRYFDERVRNLSGEFSLAMIDVDNFKQVNDSFGHPVGDKVLFALAQAIRSVLRKDDRLIRYGGDEFLVVFRGLEKENLQKKLHDICLSSQNVTSEEYPDLKLSISAGGYCGSGRISEMIDKADKALYRAKLKKNHAEVYKDED